MTRKALSKGQGDGTPSGRGAHQPPADGSAEKRYYFFLNPYQDMAFTKCPKCERRTKERKFALVIHIEPSQLLILNKKCRYCEQCDLIIARKAELEHLMAVAFERRDPTIIGNNYLVIGTLPRALWRAYRGTPTRPIDVLNRTSIFKDKWQFEITGGWTLSEPKHAG